jgi:hypothetical protein
MVMGIVLMTIMLVMGVIACSGKKDGGTADNDRKAVSNQNNNSEKDFQVEIAEGENGKGIWIVGYMGNKREVNIPLRINDLPVVVIGMGAFMGKNLTEIVIPDTVYGIWPNALADNKLVSITIGPGVDIDHAFSYAGDRASFEELYRNSGRKAGVYKRSDENSGVWTNTTISGRKMLSGSLNGTWIGGQKGEEDKYMFIFEGFNYTLMVKQDSEYVNNNKGEYTLKSYNMETESYEQIITHVWRRGLWMEERYMPRFSYIGNRTDDSLTWMERASANDSSWVEHYIKQ